MEKNQKKNHIDTVCLFSGNAHPKLAGEIARYLGLTLGNAEIRRFSDGEVWVEIHDNVRGKDIFVVQPTSSPANENLMELLIIIDALKRASAKTICAVIPYYGYARQDRKVQPRTPISSKLVADLLTVAGATRVLSIDLHAGQIQGFFNIPVDHLFALPVFLDRFGKELDENCVIVAPDAGGAERARAYAKRLKAGLALIDKRRPRPNVSEVMNVIGEVDGKIAVIVDDIVDTAGTLASAANALREQGAARVYACCSHPVLSGSAIERIGNSGLEKLFVTNTIALSEAAQACPKIECLSVGNLLGEAIYRIAAKESVSSLFV